MDKESFVIVGCLTSKEDAEEVSAIVKAFFIGEHSKALARSIYV